jgi:Ca2+-binding RTX toxin-like protein
MVLQIIGSNSIGTGIRVDLMTTDSAFIAAGVAVGSTNNAGIAGTGNLHYVHVEGTVVGFVRAITIGDAVTDFHEGLLIGEAGYVCNSTNADDAAVSVLGSQSAIDNRGTIFGRVDGLYVGGADASPEARTTIDNSGVIEGPQHAISRYAGAINEILLNNTGEIRSDAFAFSSLTTAKDRVINGGLMTGDIDLGGGDDVYDGSAGRTQGTVLGGDGADTLTGGAFAETLDGGSGADTMRGGNGNDVYVVDTNADKVIELASAGIDTVKSSVAHTLAANVEKLILSGAGNSAGTGNALANVIIGNTGNNVLSGLAGNDVLNGGAGNDTLLGGAGNDNLTGGLNNDFFVFNTALNASTNRDVITDFNHVNDTFRLENAVFTKLGAAGALNPAFFHNGAAAADANDYVVYNQATGLLSYDLNGNAAGGAVAFAVLSNHAALAANDFVVI